MDNKAKTTGHVAAGWAGYRRVVLPPNASAVQISETRKGFYAGAAYLLAYMVKAFDAGTEPTEADLALMDDIAEELDAFAEGIHRG